MLQRVPDFIDFIPWIDADLHPPPILQIQHPRTVASLGKQQASKPGIKSILHRQSCLFAGFQPTHPHMTQAAGQPWLQAGGIALGGFAQVFHHRFGRLQLTLHVRQRLVHQQAHARQGHQGEKSAHPQVDPPQGRHA
ncbi:hypothetical protein D3C87_1565590 [compost metagenome]